MAVLDTPDAGVCGERSAPPPPASPRSGRARPAPRPQPLLPGSWAFRTGGSRVTRWPSLTGPKMGYSTR